MFGYNRIRKEAGEHGKFQTPGIPDRSLDGRQQGGNFALKIPLQCVIIEVTR